MREKAEYIESYINAIINKLSLMGVKVTEKQIDKIKKLYLNSSRNFDEMKNDVYRIISTILKDAAIELDEKQIYDLELEYSGITLNNQDIDLMLIAGANTIEELQEALSKITNIMENIDALNLTQEEFARIRQEMFDKYLRTLISKNEYIKNKNIELREKIKYLLLSEVLTEEEKIVLGDIIKYSKNTSEILEKLNNTFSKDKIHNIFETLRDISPIEKSGIKSMTLEAARNLLEEIKNNYNSITIDEEAKYGKIALADETFDFRHLKKSLDFAKKLNKTVRLNTLLFYMDCPEELYKLEKTSENKQLVKEKLKNYVDATTKFISENGYTTTVRSIDVFNELLNRFAMNGNPPYMYRGDIPQTKTIMPNSEEIIDDNIKSGWLKHLDIKDLCDVIAIARKNLPNTDFMYNDDNLIDPKKMEATRNLLKQIREQEERLGVKLIDSIGTQMHIDNNMTKIQMKEMIINLSEFGLPIEITEFDIAMTHKLENFTSQEIDVLRQAKINEIYECVEELKNQHNIRGFTIWSKTDKQNFRVTLENEARIFRGEEPIDTLHGGYYTDQMKPKTKILIKNENAQNFNYHTHTHRCGHAEIISDKEYVEYAKKNGFVQLGVSDHVPVTDLEYQDEEQQMHITEVDEYVASIRKLQKENPDMTINCGFEVEYNPMKDKFLIELREKVDYMILGQHFVPSGLGQISKNNPEYPLRYAEMVCKAMETGIFDIVAHPDTFMKFRDRMETEEEKRIFLENAQTASRLICEKARSLNIPLEFNLGGMITGNKLSDGEYGYPHSLFWNIATETKSPVLYGVDAHSPKQFDKARICENQVDDIVNPEKLTFVDKNYNPKTARKNNGKLNELYERTKSNAVSYETNLISFINLDIMQRIPDNEFNPDIFLKMSNRMFDAIVEDSKHKANDKEKKLVDKAKIINTNEHLSEAQKTIRQERITRAQTNINKTLTNQQQALTRAKESIREAIELGCKDKNETFIALRKITEEKQKKTYQVNNHLENTNQSIKKEGPVLVKKKPSNANGFVNTITLIVIITSILVLYYICLK